jgi:prepilin-type N-terminal cleavage/methylation domain-containing protein
MMDTHSIDRSRHGFSLMELAIVLGIMGLIIGSIWALGSQAWESAHREQLKEAINTTVSNIRDSFIGQAGLQALGVSCMSSQFILHGIIPPDLKRSSAKGCGNPAGLCADTPWGPADPVGPSPAGTFRACDWDLTFSTCQNPPPGTACPPVIPPKTSQVFAVVIRGLNAAQCIDTAVNASGPSGSPGLMEVNINDCNIIAGAGSGCFTPPLGKSFPVSSADANKFCHLPPKQNVIRLFYRFRLPAH